MNQKVKISNFWFLINDFWYELRLNEAFHVGLCLEMMMKRLKWNVLVLLMAWKKGNFHYFRKFLKLDKSTSKECFLMTCFRDYQSSSNSVLSFQLRAVWEHLSTLNILMIFSEFLNVLAHWQIFHYLYVINRFTSSKSPLETLSLNWSLLYY